MNDELITDLKQFITATVSQAFASAATRDDIAELRAEMTTKADLAVLRTEMKGRFDELDIKVSTIADAHAEMLDEHDRRMTRLEEHAA